MTCMEVRGVTCHTHEDLILVASVPGVDSYQHLPAFLYWAFNQMEIKKNRDYEKK